MIRDKMPFPNIFSPKTVILSNSQNYHHYLNNSQCLNGLACHEEDDDDDETSNAVEEELTPSTNGSTLSFSDCLSTESPEEVEHLEAEIYAIGKSKRRKFKTNRERRLRRSITHRNVSPNRRTTDEQSNLISLEVTDSLTATKFESESQISQKDSSNAENENNLNCLELTDPLSATTFDNESQKDISNVDSEERSSKNIRRSRLEPIRRASQEELVKFESELQEFARSPKKIFEWKGEMGIHQMMEQLKDSNLEKDLDEESDDSGSVYHPNGTYRKRKRGKDRRKSTTLKKAKTIISVPKERPKTRKLFSMEAYLQSEEFIKSLSEYSQSVP